MFIYLLLNFIAGCVNWFVFIAFIMFMVMSGAAEGDIVSILPGLFFGVLLFLFLSILSAFNLSKKATAKFPKKFFVWGIIYNIPFLVASIVMFYFSANEKGLWMVSAVYLSITVIIYLASLSGGLKGRKIVKNK